MHKEFEIEEYTEIEEQIHYYCQCLLVNHPEQIIRYLEKRLEKYTETLKHAHLYPEKIILSIQHLVIEYSCDLARIRRYLNLET
ncbi:hypothetical protein ACRS6Y_08935 [Bacillus cytotoxicus]|uniref:Group-specific protein n=2 Tax=Bacillus cytotoxicus TaxID=580165 RepID=A0AAX2CGQ8_9BACI|nr:MULTISPECIES: hypothetical protein [Bacillus cereus group]ABS22100.1 conserved hypothetical protein [Bacillus cytotoxicus NVH 391-98]AWC28707.1 hypothetical protein CG483_010245 [Bacillus cytotoxicus]AWC32725.1 hypothetical protein CG482_010035 [Bacillus cytotoxicus]AWC36753.1 hypothetical protein CG481_010050 [Bacillus cytotoxicus]AWC39911.1 hypothetical protein CG480_005015 [Bacillus cytotoxicus]